MNAQTLKEMVLEDDDLQTDHLRWAELFEVVGEPPEMGEEDEINARGTPVLVVLPPPATEPAAQPTAARAGTLLAGCRVSLFQNAFTKVPQEVELLEVLEGVRAGRWRPEIEELRKIRDRSIAEYDAAKRHLPGFTISGTGADRRERLTHSGLLQIDFDHIDERLSEVRALVQQDPHIAFGFVSPSGAGLKMGLRIDPERHAESFHGAVNYFREKYEIQIDEKVKDRLRLCFVSWDPEVWINPGAIPLPLPEVPAQELAAEVRASPARVPTRAGPPPSSPETGGAVSDLELNAALGRLPADDYEVWLKVGMALKSWDADRGLIQWETWSKRSPKFAPGVCAEKWKTFSGANGSGETVTVRSLLALAREADELLATRLARLDMATYDRVRDEEAKRAGLRTSVLDALVNAKRSTAPAIQQQSPLAPDPEPWPESVDSALLLDEIARIVRRFLIVPSGVPETIALWVLHVYVMGEFSHSPILAFISPTKRCGKSVALDLLTKLTIRPLLTANATPAALYRAIELWHPTLLIDEFDSHSQEEAQVQLRNILNSGFQKNGSVLRCDGEEMVPKSFTTFCPKVVGSIGDLPDTAMDRAIVVRMRRKLSSEVTESLREYDCPDLRRQCVRWAVDHQAWLREIHPELPTALNDREKDIWHPLFVIAERAGGHWPETVRTAALELTGGELEETIGGTLLKDIGVVFTELGTDRVSTKDLLEKLNGIEERPWGTFSRGQPLNANKLGRLLKPYGIVSGTVRIAGQTPKGYMKESFQEAWERYLEGESPFQPGAKQAESPEQQVSAGTLSVTGGSFDF